MPLPPLSFEHEVTADEGREDKIDVSLGDWVIRANATEFRHLLESLSVPMRHLRDTEAGRLSGYLFTRPNVINGRVRKLFIRKTRLESAAHAAYAGKPLFGGEWVYRQGDRFADGRQEYITKLVLSLNPLRYVRYQPKPRPIASPDSWGAARILEGESRCEHGGEFALDGADNWLPDTFYFRAFANASRWEGHLHRYVQGIGNAMSAELHRPIPDYRLPVSLAQDFYLRKVEVAFEFAATESTELLRSFSEQLMAYRADGFSLQHFPATERLRVENALCFKATIRQGVSLRVYAKTNRRIRFEIIHDRINHRALLDEIPRSRGEGATRRNWTQLLRALSTLRQRSAEEMNLLFQYLRNQSRVPRSQITPLGLLVRMASAIGNHELTHTVASLLCQSSVIASRKASEELLAAVHALARSGIVEFDQRRRGYVATPPYREALGLLSNDTFRLLNTARVRRRH